MSEDIQLGRQLSAKDEANEKESLFDDSALFVDLETEEEPTREESYKSKRFKWVVMPMFFAISFFSALSILDSNFNTSDSLVKNSSIAGESTTGIIVNSDGTTTTPSEVKVTQDTSSGQGSRSFNLNASNRVAYISGGNVWVMNEDGTNKAQVTLDGSIFSSYKNVDWKSTGEITYSRCVAGECSIDLFNMNTDYKTALLTLQSPMINNISWSPDGQTMYVNYVKPDGSYEAIKFDDNTKSVNVIKQYLVNKGAIFTNNDQIGFEFSANGEYVAVINTLVQQGEDHITVYNRNGQQVTVISGETNLPEFSGDSSIYFHSDNKLFKGKMGSIQSSPIIDPFVAVDMDISPDEKHLVYWELRPGNIPVTVYRNLQTGEVRDLAVNFKVERWLNESTILGYQVENYQSIHQYDIHRLAVLDLNQNLNVLEENNVTEFSVSGY